MKDRDPARRLFLQQAAALTSTSWARLVLPSLATISQAACSAREESAAQEEIVFATLDVEEAVEFEAILARILPATDTPGAREAGVIHFLDQTFATFNAPMLNPARGGLQQFQSGIAGGAAFSTLTEMDQDAYLETQENTPFFGMIRFLTLCGFFGMSKYGGNKDDIGWNLVGVDPNAHVYESPFGYYDAEYLKENPSG
ncbi:MAG: gluconate 2-dehydrogenase subunit 3 family protein [Woeseiaceae bacterium]